MGKIFYILGKSASGKDSLYQALRADQTLGLKGVTMYTTRPRRVGEEDGREYFCACKRTEETHRDSHLSDSSRTLELLHSG